MLQDIVNIFSMFWLWDFIVFIIKVFLWVFGYIFRNFEFNVCQSEEIMALLPSNQGWSAL